MIVHFDESLNGFFYRAELEKRHFMVFAAWVGEKVVTKMLLRVRLGDLRKEFECFDFKIALCECFLDFIFSDSSSVEGRNGN
jgi:hypothetical protein